MVEFVTHFYSHSSIPMGCNASFCTLIPKVRDPKNVKDFRPISITGCQYEIIGKTLANRLTDVIGSVMSVEPSAFIKGRQILDDHFLLNQIVAWSKASKKILF